MTRSASFPRMAVRPPVLVAASQSTDPLIINSPPSFARKVVEVLLYITTLNSVFMPKTGLGEIRFLGGGPVALAGLITLTILLASRERLPTMVWFAIAMTFGAHVTMCYRDGAVPVIDPTLSCFVLWTLSLIIMFYLVGNDATTNRLLVFYSIVVLLTVYTGGFNLAEDTANKRMILKQVYGGTVGDANTLSYLSGFCVVMLLFRSLRAPVRWKPILWLLAVVGILVVLRCVSRSGVLLLGVGLMFFTLAALLGQGVRLVGILTIVGAVLGGLYVLSMSRGSIEHLSRRFEEHSNRMDVYRWETVQDLMDTAVLGRGWLFARTAVGINAHNAFIFTHMAYGGIVAYPYLMMLTVLGVRVIRMFLAADLPLDRRLQVVAVYLLCLGYQGFTNMGFFDSQCVLGMTFVDRYTAPYGHGALGRRRRAVIPGRISGGQVVAPASVTGPGLIGGAGSLKRVAR